MLIYFSLVAIFVVIVIAVLWARRPVAQATRSEPEAAPSAMASRDDIVTDVHGTVLSPAQFDPDATIFHMQPSRASGPAAPRKRAAAGLPTNACLMGLSGSHKGKTFPVLAAGVTVGRNPSCHIVLEDPRVSALHAWIGMSHGKLILRDLKSTNGTFLNVQTQTSVSEVELCSGDTIFFGGHQGDQFRFMAG